MGAGSGNTAPRLRVWRTSMEAYRLTLANGSALGAIAWAWLLLLLASMATLYWGLWPLERAARMAGRSGSALLFATTFSIGLVAGSAIAVRWHRFLLAGEDPLTGPSMRLDSTVARYLSWTALLLLPLFALLGLLVGSEAVADEVEADASRPLVTLLGLLAVAMVLLALMRLSLVLPAIALCEAQATLAAAWRRTRGNTWRLATAFLLTGIPILALVALFTSADISSHDMADRSLYVMRNTLLELAMMVLGMLSVSLLSLAYRELAVPPAATSVRAPDAPSAEPKRPSEDAEQPGPIG